ncbi:breakpoint cluster region protein-like, partial [Mustelus asterias]
MEIFLDASSYLAAHGIPVSKAAQEDPEDDQVFGEGVVAPSARDQSEAPSVTRRSDSTGTFSPLDPETQVELDPEKQLQRRRMVLNKVLENERVYISELESLLVPLRPLRAAAYSSQPMLTNQEIQNIFFKIPELLEIHREFHSKLSERVQGSDDSQPVGDLFHQLVKQFGVYRAFVNNYPVAVETAEKCVQNKEQFRKIAERMWLKHSKHTATTTLEALLYKPVNHVTRFTLLIREVMTHTPREHCDFCRLGGALNDSNSFLSATNQNIHSKCSNQNDNSTKVQHLVKDGFAVEVSENCRKLRHIFLSTELFFCTRVKKQIGKQPQYKCEWSVALEELSVQTQSEIHLMDPARLQTIPQQQIEETKAKLLHSKIQIYLEK